MVIFKAIPLRLEHCAEESDGVKCCEGCKARFVSFDLFFFCWFVWGGGGGIALNPLKPCENAPSFGMPPFRTSDKIAEDLKYLRTSFFSSNGSLGLAFPLSLLLAVPVHSPVCCLLLLVTK